MPDPTSHHPDMLIIKGQTLPRFWWLNPWTTARALAVTVNALRAYADRADAHIATLNAEREETSK